MKCGIRLFRPANPIWIVAAQNPFFLLFGNAGEIPLSRNSPMNIHATDIHSEATPSLKSEQRNSKPEPNFLIILMRTDFLLVQASEAIRLDMLRSAHTQKAHAHPYRMCRWRHEAKTVHFCCYRHASRVAKECAIALRYHALAERSTFGAGNRFHGSFPNKTTTTFGTSTTQIIHVRRATQCAAGRFDG